MFLEADNLEKNWPGTSIALSLRQEQGTLTAIVGPSGSGKSTVLRILAGLERSDGDRTKIVIGGTDVTNLAPGKRGCGMVAQSPALFVHMSVRDNVAYGLRCAGTPKRQARAMAEEFLGDLGIRHLALRSPETLSGGEAQRVSLARTLIVRPRLLLLDEPLSALDAPLRKKLACDIRDMQRRLGITAVLVTHDIAEARLMADRIVLLKGGTVRWQGTPDQFSERLFTDA